jgi:hypothetical protein
MRFRILDPGSWQPGILSTVYPGSGMGKSCKNYITFCPKIVIKLSKIWVWDPRSGIREIPILDPRSRGQKSTGYRIRKSDLRSSTVDVYAFSPPYSILKPNCTASVLYCTTVPCTYACFCSHESVCKLAFIDNVAEIEIF